MIIFLDESGDLGFNFSATGTSHYLIMSSLICNTANAVRAMKRAIKLTLKNKISVNINEVKGSNTSLSIKKYFLKHIEVEQEWEIMAIAADKRAWLRHHDNKAANIDKNLFYDEVAKRLLSQIQLTTQTEPIQIIVDKSKTPSALRDFDQRISAALRPFV